VCEYAQSQSRQERKHYIALMCCATYTATRTNGKPVPFSMQFIALTPMSCTYLCLAGILHELQFLLLALLWLLTSTIAAAAALARAASLRFLLMSWLACKVWHRASHAVQCSSCNFEHQRTSIAASPTVVKTQLTIYEHYSTSISVQLKRVTPLLLSALLQQLR
jgi:amino acid permease